MVVCVAHVGLYLKVETAVVIISNSGEITTIKTVHWITDTRINCGSL